ncbi:MAG TPA: hypothetical protein PLN64_01580 [Candidatus Bipolaricaulis anaerobius]|nr:hypothetical protein [Candidatus Bipolaricaulis anaerobius]
MKAVLEFELPDDAPEFKLATQAGALLSVILDVDRHLRNRLKYHKLSKTAATELGAARDTLLTSCRERRIDPWDE